MPVIWGTSEKKLIEGSSLSQYTKWFELTGLDFEILRQAGRWTVTCWTVYEKEFVASASSLNVDTALHEVYSVVTGRRRAPLQVNKDKKKPQPEG